MQCLGRNWRRVKLTLQFCIYLENCENTEKQLKSELEKELNIFKVREGFLSLPVLQPFTYSFFCASLLFLCIISLILTAFASGSCICIYVFSQGLMLWIECPKFIHT